MKTQALRTPHVLIACYDEDKEKPPATEMRKQVLQDALEQPLHEPGSVQGHLRTDFISTYLKTSNVKTISMEPQVTTDRESNHDRKDRGDNTIEQED